jgi:FAD dependent oxidoreductase TIGR03364
VLVTSCSDGVIRAGSRRWDVDHVWLAPGADLLTLYPELFAGLGLRRCKLQMMRTAPMALPIGPVIAGGLTLAHYDSFQGCPSLDRLTGRLSRDWPQQRAFGVHVLVSRHDGGEVVIGDSHEYDAAITPFDKPAIDELILDYMRTLLEMPSLKIAERWHGVYVKSATAPYEVRTSDAGVTIVAGLGGHGMTLSFGLAETVVSTAARGIS